MAKSNGGRVSIEKTRLHQYLEQLKASVFDPDQPGCVVGKIAPAPDHKNSIRILGKGFTPQSVAYVNGKRVETTFIGSGEVRIGKPVSEDPSAHVLVSNEIPLSLSEAFTKTQYERLAITDVRPLRELPLQTNQPFAIKIAFNRAGRSVVKMMKLVVKFPDGSQQEQFYSVSRNESARGEKVIENLSIERGGMLSMRVSLYDSAGNADYLERTFSVVPSNPLQLYVYAQHGSPSGAGGAHYNSSNDRYYCYGRWVISNGNAYAVTIGPNVRCRVSDAGLGELADFSFDIGMLTIPAYATRTIYVQTWHGSGSDVYDLFEDFGDATYQFWLDTSDGQISDSYVWAASAQVGVTANFVGSFSWSERVKVRDIIDTHSTGIYSQVDCIFSPDTPILEIPSSDSDWEQYRDIRVEEDKDGDCVDSDEADDLRDDWSSPSAYDHRIDIFFVESFSGATCASSLGGFSPVDGPTGKGSSRSGIVIDVKDLNILTSTWGEETLGVVIAHEVGHFLGIEGHSSAANNFMNASVGSNNTNITYGQWKTMRDHDFVRIYNPS
jgi:hypothetical protein